MSNFRKKLVVIEAIQYDGTENSVVEILQLKETNDSAKSIRVDAGGLLIHTVEAVMRADKGDWIIKDVNGELYPCKPDIFEKTYEPYNSTSSLIDIKHLNIPNVCFSLTDSDDSREIEYSKQRQLRGFDDSETWSLTDTICNFILPRLIRFKEINASTPAQLTEEEWSNILDKMIIAFQLTSKDSGSRIWIDNETEQVKDGLDLFREWFMHLWW